MTRYRIGAHGVEAVVSARAGALRLLRVAGVDLVEPTVNVADPPGMSGAVLAPWPNRVEGAVWWHEGREQRLEVTEPELGHANHGLLAATDFVLVRSSTRGVVLGGRFDAPPGYPFRLEVRVRYRLRPDGLAVRIAVRNAGAAPAPVALGAHPYLRIGDVPSEELRVRIDADARGELDAAHIPRGWSDVGDGDLRAPQRLATAPGHATLVHRGAARPLRHGLEAPDGRAVELRADAAFRWTQLYRAEGFPADDGPRTAIAIEPMTAPPNALRSGDGIRLLPPGRVWRTGFGIRLRRPGQAPGWSRAR
jgi:aldose 1-epimerase